MCVNYVDIDIIDSNYKKYFTIKSTNQKIELKYGKQKAIQHSENCKANIELQRKNKQIILKIRLRKY